MNSSIFPRRHAVTVGALILGAIFVGVMVRPSVARSVSLLEEWLALSFSEESATIYSYAVRHMNARESALYDLGRAEELLLHVAASDARYPFVQHQLARVAFLRADYEMALLRIDNEIQNASSSVPSTRYMRGLILGFMGRYDEAAREYRLYLDEVPNNWAGINDYVWVLLKGAMYEKAALETKKGLDMYPGNAWLLNSRMIALYEMGDIAGAYQLTQEALHAADRVTKQEWLQAYPGNDPKIADIGLTTFKESVAMNAKKIRESYEFSDAGKN